MYQRVILKLSGELFASPDQPVSLTEIRKLAEHIHQAIKNTNVNMGIVIGGGNIIRGRDSDRIGIDRNAIDYMGMTATVINGIALTEALSEYGYDVRLTNALTMPHVSENFSHKKVAHHFKQGRIVIFAGGLGRPFHSTDSAAAQAAAEFNADIILKASTIDGVYDKDPHKFPDAVRYSTLTYDEAIVKNLRIMDQEALAKCRDNHLTVFVFDASNLSRLTEIISGDMRLGTIINSK